MRVEIEAGAAKKKEAAGRKKAEELQRIEAKADEMRKASKRIAETMDQKVREEAAAVARMNKTPPPEDEERSDDHAGESNML